jgi:hypothetical protein
MSTLTDDLLDGEAAVVGAWAYDDIGAQSGAAIIITWKMRQQSLTVISDRVVVARRQMSFLCPAEMDSIVVHVRGPARVGSTRRVRMDPV